MMIKLENILCPLDLSEDSAAALRYAVALTKSYEAKLYLYHCTDSVKLSVESCREMLGDVMMDQARKHSGILSFASIVCETIVTDGNPSEDIARLVTDKNIDLIVMASRRHYGAGALLGSTAETVSHNAACPLLIVHPDEREWVGKTTSQIDLHRILIAQDFSTASKLALNFGLSLAQEYQTELHLLHVLPYSLPLRVSEMTDEETAAFHQAALRLYKAVPAEAFLWCEVKQTIRAGEPYAEILDYAETRQIDLICMGAQDASFVKRAVFGSNTDRVLRQAPCPVLIARARQSNSATQVEAQQFLRAAFENHPHKQSSP
jgi:nucleotide-binding universal stress UspA family protein